MALLALIAARAEATTIVYTDRDAFNAAAGNTTLFTFDPVVCQPRPDLFPPTLFCDVNYGLVSKRYELNVSPGSLAPPYIQISGFTDANLPISFAQSITAVGFDVIPLEPGPIAFTVSLFEEFFPAPGEKFVMSSPSFLGFVSTSTTSGPLFINPNHCTDFSGRFPRACQFAIDNMAVQPVQPVPESDTFCLEAFFAALFLLLAAHIPR